LTGALGPDDATDSGAGTERMTAPLRTSVTIRDVARVANVHPGTVSRALNAETRALVTQETADRVMRAVKELGYRPNPIARGLKTNRSYTIGVLIPDITNPLFPPILRGIEDRLDDDGYTSLIVNTDNDDERERSHLEAMRARQVDGLISATARLDRRSPAGVAAGGTPLVLVNRSLEDGSVPAVTVDDREGIRLAVAHIAGLGHTRIGHLAGPQNVSTGHRRYLGFLEAMRDSGLDAPDEQVRFSRWFTEAEGARVCRELLDAVRDTTAIVAANDRLAIGCYDALEALGLCCPDDVSITGFNDMPFVGRLRPPLTSVRVPQREIGTVAADLLLQRLGDGSQGACEILLEPTLVVRGSTARPREHPLVRRSAL
jgi:LacI family transcriptional regulator